MIQSSWEYFFHQHKKILLHVHGNKINHFPTILSVPIRYISHYSMELIVQIKNKTLKNLLIFIIDTWGQRVIRKYQKQWMLCHFLNHYIFFRAGWTTIQLGHHSMKVIGWITCVMVGAPDSIPRVTFTRACGSTMCGMERAPWDGWTETRCTPGSGKMAYRYMLCI